MTHDPKLVEAVAQAILDTLCKNSGLHPLEGEPANWREEATAALDAIEAAGCVVVPMEMTDAMRLAVWRLQAEKAIKRNPDVSAENAEAVVSLRMADPVQQDIDHSAYRAMLAARPGGTP